MYNATRLKDKLMGLVGWQQADPELTADLIESRSGLTFNSQHPLLTDKNLRSIAPDPAAENFNTWLTQQTQDGIVQAIQRITAEQLARNSATGILASRNIYQQTGNTTLVDISEKTYGVRIQVIPALGVIASIDRVSLMFEEDVTVSLKLWHTSQKDHVKQQNLEYNRAGSRQWFQLEEKWKLEGEHIDGHHWYVTHDIFAAATKGTGGFGVGDPKMAVSFAQPATIYTKHYAVTPICIPHTETMWPEEYEEETEESAGLNLHISINTDFTDFFIDQQQHMQDIIAKQVALKILRIMAFNPENRIGREGVAFRKSEILYEIDGDSTSMKKSGLKYEYEMALQGVILDINKLDSLVFSKKRKSLRYGSIV